jgi:hypothetical protein
MFCVEAGTNRARAVQTSQEQSRTDQDEDRERYLVDHERVAQAKNLPPIEFLVIVLERRHEFTS